MFQWKQQYSAVHVHSFIFYFLREFLTVVYDDDYLLLMMLLVHLSGGETRSLNGLKMYTVYVRVLDRINSLRILSAETFNL